MPYKTMESLSSSSLRQTSASGLCCPPNAISHHRSHMFQGAAARPPFRCSVPPRQPLVQSFSVENPSVNGAAPPSLHSTADGCVGVLLLNLGGPETLDDVQPFLYNLFADPDIIRLPAPAQFLQPAIAQLVSTLRAPKSREGYEAIGGGSPLRRITQEQAEALERALAAKGSPARTYVAMRYWKPFTGKQKEKTRGGESNLTLFFQPFP